MKTHLNFVSINNVLQLSYNRMINHHGWKTGLKSTSCLHVYTEKTRLLNSWRVIHFLTLSAFLCYNPKNDLLLFSFYFSRNKLTINNPVKVFDKAIWGQNFSLQMTKISEYENLLLMKRVLIEWNVMSFLWSSYLFFKAMR
jgi:hypothetical protein